MEDDEPLRLRVEAELREQGLSVAIDPASIGRIAALLGAQDWRKREGDWWGCLLVAAAALGGYAMAARRCRAPSRPLGGASGQVSKACPLGPGSSPAAQVPEAICQRSREWPGVGHGDQFAVSGGSCEFETLSVWRAAAAQCYLRGGMFCLPRV